jgi:hypothetical protein
VLVADLELRGPSRLDWVERTWLSGTGRSLPELQAALQALSVQGGADVAVPRARVVGAYRGFVRSGHALAGHPALDLLSWRAWDAVPDYVALLRAMRRAILAPMTASTGAQAMHEMRSASR